MAKIRAWVVVNLGVG